MVSVIYRLIREKVYQYAIDKSNETQDGKIEIVEFQKEHPYIMDLTVYRYQFEKYK